MTATDTEAALLAAVRANPAEDAPRLVWADWLEENAGTVQRCSGTHRHDGEKFPLISGGFAWDAHGVIHRSNPKQPHHHCDEKCRVSDGRAELAAFIRVQVELAARDDERCRCRECQPTGQHTNEPCRSSLKPLRRRVRELWPAVQGHFLPRDGLKWLPMLDGRDSQLLIDARTQMPLVLIRRGLPAVVRCTLAEWMGGECGQCQGRGQRTIYGDGSGPWTKCQYCVDGLTPGIGPRLAQAWPLVRVEVTDAVIHPSGGNSTYYVGGLGIFPKEFWRRLEGHRTPSAARAALSDALIAWARGQAIEDIK